jgi:ABC-type transport system involved in multi-copper enzyme maturation permease subunit
VGAPDEGGAAAALASPGADPGRLAGVTAIWSREIRGRMRGKRAFIFITVYLGILVGLFWAALQAGRDLWAMGALESIAFGRGVFVAVIFIETLVIVALAPAYTAGLISQEREKQTFDLLSVTPISSFAIVLGKLLSGLSYLALVVAASIPIASIAFLFGGVDVIDIVRGYAILVVTGIGVGSIGVWCSAAMKRTQPATVSAFIVTALLVVGASGVWIILDSRAREEGTARPPEALLYLNPFAAISDAVCQATGSGCFVAETLARSDTIPAPAQAVPIGAAPALGGGGPCPDLQGNFGPQCFQGNGFQQFQPFVKPVVGGDFWPKSVLFYALLTPIALFGAAQSLSPTRRWHWSGRKPPRSLSGKAIDG